MSLLNEVLMWIVQVGFSLYISILWLRFLLQLLHADYYNPIAQFVVRTTAPLITPLRRIIPGNRSWEPSALLLIILFKMVELTLQSKLAGEGALPPVPLVILTVVSLLYLAGDFYYWALIISVILSWVGPGNYSPAAVLVHQITEPLLAPCRRLLPDTGGIDFSPLVAFLGIFIFQRLLGLAVQQLAPFMGLS